jgi:hypothetical protein
MKKQQRRGSIPLVMLVVMVLAVGAGASLFLSQSTARMEYRFGLKTQASALAQSAVEEVMVRLQNGSAGWDSEAQSRFVFDPKSTKQVAAILEQKGIKATVYPVQIMGRLAEAPNNPADAADFERLMKIGPYFGSTHLYAKLAAIGQSDYRWSKGMKADAVFASKIQVGGESLPNWIDENLPEDLINNADYNVEYQGIGSYMTKYGNYLDRNPGDFDEATGDEVAKSFEELTPLSEVTGWENTPLDTPVHSAAELDGFAVQWNKAMEAVGEHVQNRIDGCDGDKRYGLGALFSSFVLDGPADNNADEEEAFVETSDEQLEYKSYLVSLATQVDIESAGVKTRQEYQAHRIASSMNATDAVSKLRDQTMLYLMYVYNLYPQDIQYLVDNNEDWANAAVIEETGGVFQMKTMPNFHGALYARHGDLSGKVLSSLGTTCLAKTKEM